MSYILFSHTIEKFPFNTLSSIGNFASKRKYFQLPFFTFKKLLDQKIFLFSLTCEKNYLKTFPSSAKFREKEIRCNTRVEQCPAR